MKKGPFSRYPETRAISEGKPQTEIDRLKQAREHAESSMFLHMKTLTWSDVKAKFSEKLIMEKFGGLEEVNRVRNSRLEAEALKKKEFEEQKKKEEEEMEAKRKAEEGEDNDSDVEMDIADEHDVSDNDENVTKVDESTRLMRERDAKTLTDSKRWRQGEDGAYSYDDEIHSLYCNGCGELVLQKRKRVKLMMELLD